MGNNTGPISNAPAFCIHTELFPRATLQFPTTARATVHHRQSTARLDWGTHQGYMATTLSSRREGYTQRRVKEFRIWRYI